MNLEMLSPPPLTGQSETDIAALSDWCALLCTKLKFVLNNLDGTNIASVPEDRIIYGESNDN